MKNYQTVFSIVVHQNLKKRLVENSTMKMCAGLTLVYINDINHENWHIHIIYALKFIQNKQKKIIFWKKW